MKCLQCGHPMKTRRENYRYDASGLPVTLLGVEVSRCSHCGEHEVEIPRVEELHHRIALKVISKRSRLTPAEIRFLRKTLGWSGADFARHIGVDAGTVSKWENGAVRMGPIADRLLRLMVAHGQPVGDYSVDRLAEVADEEATSTRIGMKANDKGWQDDVAA